MPLDTTEDAADVAPHSIVLSDEKQQRLLAIALAVYHDDTEVARPLLRDLYVKDKSLIDHFSAIVKAETGEDADYVNWRGMALIAKELEDVGLTPVPFESGFDAGFLVRTNYEADSEIFDPDTDTDECVFLLDIVDMLQASIKPFEGMHVVCSFVAQYAADKAGELAMADLEDDEDEDGEDEAA